MQFSANQLFIEVISVVLLTGICIRESYLLAMKLEDVPWGQSKNNQLRNWQSGSISQ